MLVAVPVSSRNTNRAGSIKRCQARQRRRFWATPGRSCSAALSDLWNGPPLHPTGLRSMGTRRRGADHADCGDRDRPWQDRVQPCCAGRERCAGQAPAAAAREHCRVQQGSATVHHCHGGMLRGPPPRPSARSPGHRVRLMSPEYVRPYVKAQKNDDRDAEAIAEAASRPTMRFVELKSEAQLDMQTLHRARDRLVGARTALINQLRGILLERGITLPQGRRKLHRQLALLLEEDGGLLISSRMMALVEDMRAQWAELDRRIGALDDEMVEHARNDETVRRLISIPGIGALNATALIAAVGDAGTFARARDLAAWLGLVPRQVTTGGGRFHGGALAAA